MFRILLFLTVAVVVTIPAFDRVAEAAADSDVSIRVRPGGDIQAAIDALPAKGGTVRIAPGAYRGQVRIGKPDVQLIGEGERPQEVRIVASESAATQGSIYASATVHVAGEGFRARNLSFVNDWESRNRGSSQAAALAVSGDRALFEQVVVSGGQDSLYLARPPGRMTRQVFRNCRVEGHVDFIFGNAKAYFDRCTIHGLRHDKVMYTAQSRNHATDESGFVFHRCTFTADQPREIYLGRPWRPYARVILIDSQIVAPLSPGGWREWKPGLTNDAKTAMFAEYGTVHAAGPPQRSKIRQLTTAQAQAWTLDAFLGGDTGWAR
ncbi:pectinesterase family protein [Sphingobium aromaticiconvertens]|uniref:pectinesterase family protein n=1 Tax=Sphingobium aromaticiconvertens TaxID=365341 RepID=UPI00301ABDDC